MTARNTIEGIAGTGGGIGANSSKGLWEIGARSDPRERQLQNWPLPQIELDIPVDEDAFRQGAPWPPPNATRQQRRLDLLASVARGDLMQFVDDGEAVRVAPNYAGRLLRLLSALCTRSVQDAAMVQVLFDIVEQMGTFGRTFAVRCDGQFVSVDRRFAFRDKMGEMLFVATPMVADPKGGSGSDGSIDTMSVLAIDSVDGSGKKWTHKMQTTLGDDGQVYGTLGAQENIEDVADCGFGMADMPPRRSGHGTSILLDIIPMLVALALRLTDNTHILNAHANPTLYLPMARAKAAERVGGLADLVPTGMIQEQLIQAATRAFIRQDTIWDPDGSTTGRDPMYLTWDGNLEASFRQIDELKAMLAMLTGVPASMSWEVGDAPSGTALTKMLGTFEWIVQTAWMLVKDACEQADPGLSGDWWPAPFVDDEMADGVDVDEGDPGEPGDNLPDNAGE